MPNGQALHDYMHDVVRLNQRMPSLGRVQTCGNERMAAS